MCNPPLRSEPARAALWVLLRGGLIDCIGSDHCAYTEEEKANPDYWEMPAGISGMQMMFPLVVGEAAARGIDLSVLARLFSGAPARRFGLSSRKGSIRPGLDADLVLVDLDAPWEVRGAELFSKAPGTAYEGATVRARVVRTLVRGRTVFEDDGRRGTIDVEPGFGQFMRPLVAAPASA
jgi:allantoinase